MKKIINTDKKIDFSQQEVARHKHNQKYYFVITMFK